MKAIMNFEERDPPDKVNKRHQQPFVSVLILTCAGALGAFIWRRWIRGSNKRGSDAHNSITELNNDDLPYEEVSDNCHNDELVESASLAPRVSRICATPEMIMLMIKKSTPDIMVGVVSYFGYRISHMQALNVKKFCSAYSTQELEKIIERAFFRRPTTPKKIEGTSSSMPVGPTTHSEEVTIMDLYAEELLRSDDLIKDYEDIVTIDRSLFPPRVTRLFYPTPRILSVLVKTSSPVNMVRVLTSFGMKLSLKKAEQVQSYCMPCSLNEVENMIECTFFKNTRSSPQLFLKDRYQIINECSTSSATSRVEEDKKQTEDELVESASLAPRVSHIYATPEMITLMIKKATPDIMVGVLSYFGFRISHIQALNVKRFFAAYSTQEIEKMIERAFLRRAPTPKQIEGTRSSMPMGPTVHREEQIEGTSREQAAHSLVMKRPITKKDSLSLSLSD